MMAYRSDRRGDVPITALAHEAGHSIGSPRANSMMARSPGSTVEAADTTAVRLCACVDASRRSAAPFRARPGPAAAFGGALRAAWTRAHAAAEYSYAPKADLRRP
jgi:hypothetical protein